MVDVELANSYLESRVLELEMLIQMPELFVDEYFAAVRNEIDVDAETRLLMINSASDEALFLNSRRREMLDELDRHREKCLERLKDRSVSLVYDSSTYRAQLDHLRSEADSHDPRLIDKYICLKNAIEKDFKDFSFAVLLRKRFAFVGHKDLAILLVLDDLNLTKAEIAWLKYPLNLGQTMEIGFEARITRQINKLDQEADKFLFKTKLPLNLMTLLNIQSQIRNSMMTILSGKAVIHVELLPKSKTNTFSLRDCDVQVVPTGALSDFPMLEMLNLRFLGLEFLEAGALKSLAHLKSIVLESNKITSIDENLFNDSPLLENINLQDNLIEFVHPKAFEKTKKLHLLDLQKNRISEIDQELLSNLVSLRYLFLNDNRIKSIEDGVFNGCRSLLKLNLNNNHLAEINLAPFRQTNLLINLELSSNRIARIRNSTLETDSFQVNSYRKASLKKLRLHNNQLNELARGSFMNFHRLEFLTLHHNKIESIHESAFDRLESLVSLDLGSNCIKEIHAGTFSDLEHLKYLNLQQNRLESLPEDLFANNPSLDVLNLKDNRLVQIYATETVHLRLLFVDKGVKKRNYKTPLQINYKWRCLIVLFIFFLIGFLILALIYMLVYGSKEILKKLIDIFE